MLSLKPESFQHFKLSIGRIYGQYVKATSYSFFFWKSATRLQIDQDFFSSDGTYEMHFDVSEAANSEQKYRPLSTIGSRRYGSTAIAYQLSYVHASETTVRMVANAVDDWSKDNQIEVEQSARQEILNQFKSFPNDALVESFTRYEKQFSGYYSYLRTFVRMYLYEIVRRRRPENARPDLARNFQAASPNFYGPIRMPEIIVLPISNFMNYWVNLMKETWVEIESKPPRMTVSTGQSIKTSDPLTNGHYLFPSKQVEVRVSGNGNVCGPISLRFTCPGYHGALTCIADQKAFDDKTFETCQLDESRTKLSGAGSN